MEAVRGWVWIFSGIAQSHFIYWSLEKLTNSGMPANMANLRQDMRRE